MGVFDLNTKARESDRIIADATKAQDTLNAHVAKANAAKADYDRAFEAGDAEAMVAAKALHEACNALAVKQREIVAEHERKVAAALDADARDEEDRHDAGLDKREARQAATFERDFAKAAAPLIAFLSARAGDAAEVAEANKRRAARGLSPILTADERARSVPGRTEPAVYEDRVTWRKHDGGPEVTVFTRSKSGEMVPAEGGAVRSVERVRVRAERHIAAQRPKPLAETVVIPGFAAGADPLWPAKVGR